MRISDWSSDVCSSDLLDLDRGYGCALKRGEKHAPQGVAQRQAKATLQLLGDEGRLALAVAALQFKAVGLLQFLPVLRVYCQGVPLEMLGSGMPRRGRRTSTGKCRRPHAIDSNPPALRRTGAETWREAWGESGW